VYFNVSFNVFFKLIKVHLLASEPYGHIYVFTNVTLPISSILFVQDNK